MIQLFRDYRAIETRDILCARTNSGAALIRRMPAGHPGNQVPHQNRLNKNKTSANAAKCRTGNGPNIVRFNIGCLGILLRDGPIKSDSAHCDAMDHPPSLRDGPGPNCDYRVRELAAEN